MAIDLNKAIKAGCWNQYSKLKKDPAPKLSKSSSGKEIVVLKNISDETVYFYGDGTWVNITKYKALSDEDKKKFVKKRWECDVAKLESDAATASATQAATKLSEEQGTYITNLVKQDDRLAKSDGTPAFKEKIEQGLYTPIDLNSDKIYGKPDLFKEPGKFFVYKKKGVTMEKDKKSLIEKWTGGTAGYEVVDCNATDTDNFAGPIVDLKKKYPEVFLESFCVVQKMNFVSTPTEWNDFLKSKVGEMKTTLSKPDKKLCRKVINNYYEAMEKRFSVENSVNIETAKNFIRQCDQKLNFSFGTKNNLNAIIYSSKKIVGNLYGIEESKLSEIIKNNLIEIKENKKNIIVEKKIINNRFNLLLEAFSEKKNLTIEKIFFRTLSESVKLRESGLSRSLIIESESGFLSTMMSMFGGGLLGSLKEYAGNWIVTQIVGEEAKKTLMAQWIIKGIGNIDSWTELTDLLTGDCDKLSRFIVESVMEGFIGRYQEKQGYGGVFVDTMRNTILDSIKSNDVVEAITKKVMGTVCKQSSSLKDKMDDAYGDLKKKIVTT
jgi:predicted metallopeptidase